MRGFSTFWARIFWSIVPIVLSFLVFQAFMNVREYRRLVTEEFRKRGQAMAANLASSSELGVFTEDRQLLGAPLRGAVRDPDVAYVIVHGEDGRILADAGRQAVEITARIEQVAWDRSLTRDVEHKGERFIEFVAPVVSEEEKSAEQVLIEAPGEARGEPLVEGRGRRQRARVIGGVRLGLSLQSVEGHVQSLVKLWGGITLGFLILSTLAVYGFSRRITRPVNRLTEQAQKIAAGYLDQKIPVESRDEIGQLAAAFNDMTGALKANIEDKERVLAELQELNRTLEDRIEQRTAELQDRSRALERSLEEVRAMGEISRAVGSTLDLTEVLNTISAHAVRLSGSDACGIFELDEVRQSFVVVASHNFSEQFLIALQSATIVSGSDVRRGPISRAMQSGQPVQVPDITVAQDVAFRELYLEAGFKALLAVPMGSGNISRAMTLYRSEPGVFEGRAVELLTTLANQSKVAIDNAGLFKEIEAKSRQLEVASRHKSDFLANVSHELRTPMNAILGFNEMILGQIYGDVPETLRVPLTDIQNSGRHLLRLINDVLDLSKIEAGRMELALVDYVVEDIVESVRASLRSLAAEKGLEFVTHVSEDIPIAYGDGKRITQCLMNLAGNALKFTRQGRVEISVALQGDRLLYRVADTGIGIARDQLDQVFTEFRQADATITREFGGTGLGLSISKKFIEMHGGRIWVESELGHGSTFFFTVPVRFEGGKAA
jgi:signal transduction histidine kinase